MKLFMVTTYAPLFENCGKLKEKIRVFTGVTSAKTHLNAEKKRLKDAKPVSIFLEELNLKDLKLEELRAAFGTEDIMDLVGSREILLEFNSDE